MAQLLKGKPVAEAIDSCTVDLVSQLASRGVVPKLVVLRVGENGADIAYENTVVKRGCALGVEVEVRAFPENITQVDLANEIRKVNENEAINGCLMFRPLPKHIDELEICNMLAPEKDVDGISAGSLSGVFMNTGVGFAPCTAQACMELLKFYDVPLEGKNAVVVGRSLVVGRPLAMLLLAENATVTLAHSRTQQLPEVTRSAEIVVCATGRPRAFTQEYFGHQQVVLDVGTNADSEGVFCGDVHFAECEPLVQAITPVPGGIGTVTTSVLLSHVAEAALCSGD